MYTSSQPNFLVFDNHLSSFKEGKYQLSQFTIGQILTQFRTIAIVGISRNPQKDSHQVAKYLQEHNFKIIPINPTADRILGQKTYKTLLDIPVDIQKTIEVIDVFRPSKDVPPIVDQAVQLKKRHGKPYVIWMQLGIVNNRAAEEAERVGISVVMNKCMMQERRKLFEVKDDLELEKIRAKKMQEMTKKKKDELVSSPLTVTDENFEETINKHPLMVIDCWAAWCGPCRMVAPIIDELANDHAGEVVFGKLNVDENPLTATQFNVMSIPTLLIMKNGKEVDRMVGAAPKLLIENKVKKYI